jgi:small-conductance mechanosensitive channel
MIRGVPILKRACLKGPSMNLETILRDWSEAIVRFLPNLVFIAVILVVTIIVSRRSQGLIARLAGSTQAPREIADLLGRMARIGVLLLGAVLALGQLGFGQAVLSFVAGLGIAGIVIGFALQDIVKHFAAGVLLLMLRPFRIGDEVRIGAFEGQVQDVQLRATVLKTTVGDEVLIPNADVYNSAIVNLSRYELRCHSVGLKLPAGLGVEQARAALGQALGQLPGIADTPAPSVVATGLTDAAATVELRFWVDERNHDPEAVKTAVIAAALRALSQTEPTGTSAEQQPGR